MRNGVEEVGVWANGDRNHAGEKEEMDAREALLPPNELNRLVAGTIAGCQRNHAEYL